MSSVTAANSASLLEVEDLAVEFDTYGGIVQAVRGVSFSVEEGKTLAIVGESGCGKSVTVQSMMGLIPMPPGRITSGSARLKGHEILGRTIVNGKEIRGSEIGMIFQDPMTSLNPTMTIGDQIAEPLQVHRGYSYKKAFNEAIRLLEMSKIPEAAKRARQYPFEFSGGMLQRAMIAMAIACKPSILIADEPTTALDVTTQAQILKLISEMQAVHKSGVLFITHDFGVVADIADRVVVMQYGRVVETGTVDKVLNEPKHPYTKALIASVPSLIPRSPRPRSEQVVLSGDKIQKTFGGGKSFFGLGKPNRFVHAVKDVTLDLRSGETLGIVGESGSGKSTLARCIIRLLDSDSGNIMLGDIDIRALNRAEMRPFRTKIQMVFQDPFASLNPRIKVGQIISQGPMIQGESRQNAEARARELLEIVGLDERAFNRYPHEFSGGQRQRIGIARALALDPEILVADEPVSALDVSIQAQILELLDEIRESMNLSMLFITHDLRVAAQVCDRLAVMRYGEIVETGATGEIFKNPQHSYTQDLLAAVPGKKWDRKIAR